MTTEDGEGDPPAGACPPEAVAAAGRRAGKSDRQIALDHRGRERAVACRDADGRRRANLLLRRAIRQGGR